MMATDRPVRRRLVSGLAGIVALSIFGSFFVALGVGVFAAHYDVVAHFPTSVQGLDTQSDVKMLGVTVGQVGGIALERNGTARVTLRMLPGTRIPVAVSADIEPLSIFGPEFVNLVPGPAGITSPYLHPGAVITNTSTAISFIDLLEQADNAFGAANGQDLGTILNTIGQGVAGLGPQLGQILDDSTQLAAIAQSHIPQFDQFLSNLAQLAQGLDRDAPSIASAVNGFSQLVPEISSHSDQVTTLLDQASAISSQLAAYIQDHAASFDTLVDSAAAVLQAAYADLPHFPDVFNALQEFFGQIGQAVRLPGPGGVLIGALHGGVVDELCANFIPTLNCNGGTVTP